MSTDNAPPSDKAPRKTQGRVGPLVKGWRPLSPPSRTPIDGEFCRLEPLDLARHDDALWRALGGPARAANWRYMGVGPFPRRAEFELWLTQIARGRDPMFFAILPKEGPRPGEACGVAALMRIAPEHGVFEIGHINLGLGLQQSRAATEALTLLMGRGFEAGYRRCEWKCDALNLSSRRAAQRLGFSFEGVFRQMMVVKGRNRDTAWYAALDGEWPKLQAAYRKWFAPENFDADGRQKRSLSALTAPLLAATG